MWITYMEKGKQGGALKHLLLQNDSVGLDGTT